MFDFVENKYAPGCPILVPTEWYEYNVHQDGVRAGTVICTASMAKWLERHLNVRFELARAAGSVKSAAKTKAARKNAKKSVAARKKRG